MTLQNRYSVSAVAAVDTVEVTVAILFVDTAESNIVLALVLLVNIAEMIAGLEHKPEKVRSLTNRCQPFY